MAETPHTDDPRCGCRACALNRRRPGAPSRPDRHLEHVAAAVPDFLLEPSSPPEPDPIRDVVRIGYATIDKRRLDQLVFNYRSATASSERAEWRRHRAVQSLADLGLSVRAIAERTNLDPQTVHRWVREGQQAVPVAATSRPDRSVGSL